MLLVPGMPNRLFYFCFFEYNVLSGNWIVFPFFHFLCESTRVFSGNIVKASIGRAHQFNLYRVSLRHYFYSFESVTDDGKYKRPAFCQGVIIFVPIFYWNRVPALWASEMPDDSPKIIRI